MAKATLPDSVDFADLLTIKDVVLNRKEWRSKDVLEAGWRITGWGLSKIAVDEAEDLILGRPIAIRLNDTDAFDMLAGLPDDTQEQVALVLSPALLLQLALWVATKLLVKMIS